MKTLINKNNPQIRITAPEIESYREFYTLQDKDSHYLFKMDDWTLVEEEPKHTEVWVEGRTIFEQEGEPEVDLEKEAKKIAYEVCKDLPPSEEKDNIVYYAILAAIEGIKGNLEGIPSMDLEEAAEDFVWEVMENDEDGISESSRKLRPSSRIDDFYDALEEFFKAGAEWQRKQDELTWEDIKRIVQIADSMLTGTAWDAVDYPDEQKYYEEVLKQYKEEKK